MLCLNIMDDFEVSNLNESRNEWCGRLVSIFTPLVIEGVQSIFNQAWRICLETEEPGKYLMSFQNMLSAIPQWNAVTIEEERKRIIDRSGCGYLEDLITCVHIIQMKILTCIRVGNKQKKIDVSIPNIDTFLHKLYIHVARACYKNVYLFERNISALTVQRNNRELECIVQECTIKTIRESIPTEEIIKAYMDEGVEQEEEILIEDVNEEKDEEKDEEKEKDNAIILEDEAPPPQVPTIQNINEDPIVTKLTFNDYDSMMDGDTGDVSNVNAPKTIERLEEISSERSIQRKLEEEEDDIDDKIKIHTDNIDLGEMDIMNIGNSGSTSNEPVPLDDVVEILE
jgi:ribosomal protein L24